MGREVEIVAYRRRTEKITMRAWPMLQHLTHFRAEAHVIDGIAFVEIDFRYKQGEKFCAKVYAEQPREIAWMVERGDEEWHAAGENHTALWDDGDPLMLFDLSEAAYSFAALHFWSEEN